MKNSRNIFIFVNLVILIAYFNWSIHAKEQTIDHGRLVLLELAPVDPRSLMQGDYMRLNYKINEVSDSLKLEKRGFCILTINANGSGSRTRFQQNLLQLKKDEIGVKYFSNDTRFGNSIHVGAESFFFEEGQGKKYEQAKYGGIKVDQEGNSVLIGLYDQNLKLIK